MQVPKKCLVEAVVSTDKTRTTLQNVFFTGEELVAVDGRMLAVVPALPENGDTPGYVTPQAIREARKCKPLQSLSLDTRQTLPDGRSFPRPTADDVGQFPNWKQVVPDKATPWKVTVGLNAERLATLQRAMGCEAVTLHIQDELSPILVTPAGNTIPEPAAFAVLMPVRVS